MKKYNHKLIEKKWQKKWKKEKLYRAKDFDHKPKFYCLDMFPYPSAQGLHVGHPEGYTATDIITRYLTMKGYNVLHPMGWDAFGLPAENYALKTGIHPTIQTAKNIKKIKQQVKSLGFAYDWSREINTTDPKYYKWTQWIFLQLFKHGLAYEAVVPINWCPSCKTGLANEEVVGGKCERCGMETVKKDMKQWMLKITAYADRLLKDLDDLDWEEKIKEMQRNWIGRSEGAEVKFEVKSQKSKVESEFIKVFTTRPDTLFGATYMVVAPEHPFVASLLGIKNKESRIKNIEEVKKYVDEARKKSDLQRTDLAKEKTGVELKGIKAINPVNNKEIPIWVADYVLVSYGTGAIMAVPAHDTRDFEFAQKFGLPIVEVVRPNGAPALAGQSLPKGRIPESSYTGEGILINSGQFNGRPSEQAKWEITDWLSKKGLARKAVNYKLRDWVFSRQRYWGEPIPLVFCENCAKRIKNKESRIKNNESNQGELLNPGWIAINESELPLKLPKVKEYKPTGTGESPLAEIEKWVKTKCPKCGGPAKRETNTMPQWAGSSWYWLRFIDSKNNKTLADEKKLKYWLPVDLYVGGAEHAVLHLLYSRFWNKFLCDIGVVPKVKLPNGKLSDEPFYKLRNQGIILGEDGEKMSKSRGNVINPDDVVKQYGADTLRIYEMFMGPFADAKPWSTKGIIGVRRFLERVWRLQEKVTSNKHALSRAEGYQVTSRLERLTHKTIKKVTEDIENFRFNTAISAMMILVNEFSRQTTVYSLQFEMFLKLLAPFAPHISEELWKQLNIRANPRGYPRKSASIFQEEWPKFDPKLIKEEEIEIVVQINGKVRDKVRVRAEVSEDQVKKIVLNQERIKQWLGGKEVKKFIYIKGRLVSLVV